MYMCEQMKMHFSHIPVFLPCQQPTALLTIPTMIPMATSSPAPTFRCNCCVYLYLCVYFYLCVSRCCSLWVSLVRHSVLRIGPAVDLENVSSNARWPQVTAAQESGCRLDWMSSMGCCTVQWYVFWKCMSKVMYYLNVCVSGYEQSA